MNKIKLFKPNKFIISSIITTVRNFIFKSITILLLLTNNSFAIFSKNKLPTTPVAMQIDLSKKGNKAEIDLRIETKEEKAYLEPESTAFELEFVPYDPRDDKNSKYYIGSFRRFFKEIGVLKKYLQPKYTDKEWAEIMFDDDRVTKLVGGSVPNNLGNPSMGRYPTDFINYPAIPIPDIQLMIISLDDVNKKVVYDEVLKVKKHPEIGGYFYKYLDRINLKPGNYKIITKVDSDAPKFKDTKVLIIIGSYRAKV